MLLGIYVLTVLQTPVFEVAHAVSHLLIDHEHSGNHSFADHKEDHSHKVLLVLEEGSDSQETDQQSIDKPKLNIEFFKTGLPSFTETSDRILKIPFRLQRYCDIIMENTSPPPKYLT